MQKQSKLHIYMLFSLLIVCSGCGKTAETGMNPDEKTFEVSCTGEQGELSLHLPDNWAYEMIDESSENASEGDYGIRFCPADVTEGYVEVAYKNFFGVCGTGLIYRNEKIAGRSAQINTYKDFDNWSFITFDGEYDKIIVTTYQVEEWWQENKEDVMIILNTLVFSLREE